MHLGPLHPRDIDPAVFYLLYKSSLPVFLDVQGLTRRIENRKVYPLISDHLTAALYPAQIIKANGIEYRSMLEFYQIDLTELMIRFKITESVVTLGEKGGFVQTLDGRKFKYDAKYVGSPADSTGAGDVFFAAYITSRFSNQMQIHDACRHAAKIAAQQVEGKYITNIVLDLMR